MPPPSRFKTLRLQLRRLENNLRQRRPPRRFLRLDAHFYRLLLPGRGQVRLLRDLQVLLRRTTFPRREQDGRILGCVCVGRVLSRSGAVSVRGAQGEDADYDSAICVDVEGGLGEGCC